MRNTMVWWVISTVCCVAAGLSAAGCDRGCIDDATCVPFDRKIPSIPGAGGTGSGGGTGATDGVGGTGGGIVCPDDPATGVIADECGIWVRASLPGDDNNSGTQMSPVTTIAKAIALAQAGPRRIYACGGTFAEHVDLPAGVSLFGGFDCSNNWIYRGLAYRAHLAPGIPGVTALTLLDGIEESFIGDIKAQAVNAIEPGGSSVAIFVMEHANASLRRSEVIAGNGADGAHGENGGHGGEPAQKGLTGNDGVNACIMNPGIGGAAVTLNCPDGAVSTGGYGGDGGQLAASAGGDGEPAPMANPQGSGGKGQNDAQGVSCSAGNGGAQGADGLNGFGAVGIGKITTDGQIIGAPGSDGKPGTPGQGGGGGGGSIAMALCGAAPPGGAGGGSGGTGGCGGKGGKGGQAGGSSIGIAVRLRKFVVHDTSITTGNGGDGGKGGQLQPGGQSGLPGLGGMGIVNGIKAGCGGGVGGQGGKGGNEGGGHGGHSAPIAYTPSDDIPEHDRSTFHFGEAGNGGESGAAGFPDGNGEKGTAVVLLQLDKQ